jgi:hypothetical protein
MREEFTDEQDPAEYERGHERIIDAIRATGQRPHLVVVRNSAPPKPLELPPLPPVVYRTPWWDRPVFALFLIACLAGLATAVLVMVGP